jgi:hypothetical protein
MFDVQSFGCTDQLKFHTRGSGFRGSKVQGTRFRVQRFKVQGSGFRVPFFALRATQGKQGSAQPPAKKTAGQIEKETQKKRISNPPPADCKYRTRNNECRMSK